MARPKLSVVRSRIEFETEPSEVWAILSEEDVKDVLKASVHPVDKQLATAADVLNRITVEYIQTGLRLPNSRPKRRSLELMRSNFDRLHNELSKFKDIDYRPPQLPREWVCDFSRWLTAEYDYLVAGARRKSHHKLINELLEFYEVAFGVPPTATRQGSTAKFLQTHLKKCRDIMLSVEIRPEEMSKYIAGSMFPSLGEEAIVSLIKAYLRNQRMHGKRTRWRDCWPKSTEDMAGYRNPREVQ